VDDLNEDLVEHLHKMILSLEPAQRRRARWVMNPEWEHDVMVLKTPSGIYLWDPWPVPSLYGFPVEITPDGGAPHLVTP
jgi:HK97 family phage major capsid protein